MTHTPSRGVLPPAQPTPVSSLLDVQPHSIASRVLARSAGGNVTLFTIDADEGLSEHRTPFDALALVLEGRLTITIGDDTVQVAGGSLVVLPHDVPHSLRAEEATRMLLVMLK